MTTKPTNKTATLSHELLMTIPRILSDILSKIPKPLSHHFSQLARSKYPQNILRILVSWILSRRTKTLTYPTHKLMHQNTHLPNTQLMRPHFHHILKTTFYLYNGRSKHYRNISLIFFLKCKDIWCKSIMFGNRFWNRLYVMKNTKLEMLWNIYKQVFSINQIL